MHWLTKFDEDDGEPYGVVCCCDIDEDHDGTGTPNGLSEAPDSTGGQGGATVMDYPHRYSLASRYDGGWRVFCLACTEGAQDYVYPCRVRTPAVPATEPPAVLWPGEAAVTKRVPLLDTDEVDQRKLARADELAAQGDMRIQIVQREINHVLGLEREHVHIADHGAACVLAALDLYDGWLATKETGSKP